MAKKKIMNAARVKPRMDSIPDEEMAFRLVKLYFEEIARLGFKRKLDLDAIINAYFYALSRLGRKEIEMKVIKEKVLKEESELERETKEQLFPNPEEESSTA
ncbi:MAG: hypothetical protein ABIE23_00895 [archaeon]|nr:hypothetical protein [Candidatus Micrarchaeota archaeon]